MKKYSEITPLIVCGRQRAGTRFITEILSSFDEVTLQGEIPNPITAAMKKFIEHCNFVYEKQATEEENPRRKKQRDGWRDKRKKLIFDLWAGIAQSRRVERSANCRYYGYKRPNNEIYFDFYEENFPEPKAHYVYCIRNFEDNFLSIASRWPDRNIETVADDYLSSIHQFEAMKASAPDRVHLFDLDAHIREGASYVYRAVLDPLGLVPRDAEHRQNIERFGPVNTTEGTENKPRRRILSDTEVAFLASRPDIAEAHRRVTTSGWPADSQTISNR